MKLVFALLFLATCGPFNQREAQLRIIDKHFTGCLAAAGDSAFLQRQDCVDAMSRECVIRGLKPLCALDRFEHVRRVW